MVRDWLVLRQHGLVYPCGPRKASGGSCMEDEMSVGARSQPSSSMPHPAASWATMGSWTLLDRTSTPADSLAPAKADALTYAQVCFSSLAAQSPVGEHWSRQMFCVRVQNRHTGASVFVELYASVDSS